MCGKGCWSLLLLSPRCMVWFDPSLVNYSMGTDQWSRIPGQCERKQRCWIFCEFWGWGAQKKWISDGFGGAATDFVPLKLRSCLLWLSCSRREIWVENFRKWDITLCWTQNSLGIPALCQAACKVKWELFISQNQLSACSDSIVFSAPGWSFQLCGFAVIAPGFSRWKKPGIAGSSFPWAVPGGLELFRNCLNAQICVQILFPAYWTFQKASQK